MSDMPAATTVETVKPEEEEKLLMDLDLKEEQAKTNGVGDVVDSNVNNNTTDIDMALDGEIQGGGPIPAVFQGFKLPNDGNIAGLLKMQMSRQMLQEWYLQRKEAIRPWATFFATKRFKQPLSVQRLPRRVVKNIEYFQSNYLFVFIGLFLYCLITSPLLLFAVCASLCVCYWILMRNTGKRLTILGRELTLAQQYCLVGLCNMPVLWICGAGAAIFWVLGASCFLIMTHAVLYDVENLLGPEEDSFELTMEEVV